MPQGQHTLTEVDGVVEIDPVGPATQKEVVPAQCNRRASRKRDAAEAAAQRGFAYCHKIPGKLWARSKRGKKLKESNST